MSMINTERVQSEQQRAHNKMIKDLKIVQEKLNESNSDESAAQKIKDLAAMGGTIDAATLVESLG